MVHLVRAEMLRKNGRGFSLASPRCTTGWQLRLRHGDREKRGRLTNNQPSLLVVFFLEDHDYQIYYESSP